MQKKSPELQTKVVGTRLNSYQLAFVETQRGRRTLSKYLADLVEERRVEFSGISEDMERTVDTVL